MGAETSLQGRARRQARGAEPGRVASSPSAECWSTRLALLCRDGDGLVYHQALCVPVAVQCMQCVGAGGTGVGGGAACAGARLGLPLPPGGGRAAAAGRLISSADLPAGTLMVLPGAALARAPATLKGAASCAWRSGSGAAGRGWGGLHRRRRRAPPTCWLAAAPSGSSARPAAAAVERRSAERGSSGCWAVSPASLAAAAQAGRWRHRRQQRRPAGGSALRVTRAIVQCVSIAASGSIGMRGAGAGCRSGGCRRALCISSVVS